MSSPVSAVGLAASVIPAYIQPTTMPLPPIIFPFSPNDFTISGAAKAKSTPQAGTAFGQGKTQATGRTPNTVKITISLDMFSIPPIPVQLTAMELGMLLSPNPIDTAMGNPDAIHVTFGWGPNIIMLDAIITQVDIKYERFLLGIPIQATAQVTLQEVPGPFPLTNPTSGGLAARRTHTVVEGDSLALIAHREYKDPGKWRAIAVANKIDDPMRLRPGAELLIPDRREADVLAA
jgi:nucleoid-associated protein YgaU